MLKFLKPFGSPEIKRYLCAKKMKDSMDEAKLNANYLKYLQRLERYGCYSERMVDEIGEKIKRAPFAMSDPMRGAYEGGMVDIVLNRLCLMAYDINEKAFGGPDPDNPQHPRLQANLSMLMRVLLLQHIGKAEMFVTNPDEWKLKKGYLYAFNEELSANLKLGERSLCICQRYGISVTDEEFEAIRSIDRDWEENHIIMASPLCVLTKMVNTLTGLELKNYPKNGK